MKRGFNLVGIAAGILLLAQFVPYGRNHVNPPVLKEPAWNLPETRMLAQRACFDCHSNETRWPAYSTIAPGSWLIQRDVDEGREDLNFSEWGRSYEEAKEAAGSVEKGKMPPSYYVALHPEARLDSSQIKALAAGLQATIGSNTAAKEERPGEEKK